MLHEFVDLHDTPLPPSGHEKPRKTDEASRRKLLVMMMKTRKHWSGYHRLSVWRVATMARLT